ncbi:mannitol dehydrogenase Rossmann domain protein [Mycobacterium xenopi 3993]|nr:mannitol dehydrogenase Rossmann domain protein [Mycobacterium xenopi 3993]
MSSYRARFEAVAGRSSAMAPSATKLNSAALANLPIAAPDYDRSSIRVGIAHLGTGHFHRAHQAMYIDRLLRQGLAREWGICGWGC